MQIDDIRSLLRLPLGDIKAGCNFACASILFNVIAGASVCFYKASKEALTIYGDRGERFQCVLGKYYPWGGDALPKDDCIKALYLAARNPLAHSLGLGDPLDSKQPNYHVLIGKAPMTSEQIMELEDSADRPAWTPLTIAKAETSADGVIHVVLSVPTLYWGIHRMLRSLFSSAHVVEANALAEYLLPHLAEYNWGALPLFTKADTDQKA